MSDTSGSGPFEPVTPESTGAGTQDESLGNQFLSTIPEQDRPIVERYVQAWDKGVTQRFQSIHDQYRPYKEIGLDVTELGAAVNVWQLLQNNPEKLYDALKAELEDQKAEEQRRLETTSQTYGDLPPAVVNKLEQLEKMTQTLTQQREQEELSKKQAAELAQVENWLTDLHKRHGDFDNDFVMAKVMRGMQAEDAIKAFGELRGTPKAPPRPVPPVLGGGGSAPAQTMNPADLSRQDVKGLVAKLLADVQKD